MAAKKCICERELDAQKKCKECHEDPETCECLPLEETEEEPELAGAKDI